MTDQTTLDVFSRAFDAMSREELLRALEMFRQSSHPLAFPKTRHSGSKEGWREFSTKKSACQDRHAFPADMRDRVKS
jgi:hypothetical protein